MENEFDEIDAGARPDEAVSGGKIKAEATPVKVSAFGILLGTFSVRDFRN